MTPMVCGNTSIPLSLTKNTLPGNLEDIRREKVASLATISNLIPFPDLFLPLATKCSVGIISNVLHEDLGIRTFSWCALLSAIEAADEWRATEFDEEAVSFVRISFPVSKIMIQPEPFSTGLMQLLSFYLSYGSLFMPTGCKSVFAFSNFVACSDGDISGGLLHTKRA